MHTNQVGFKPGVTTTDFDRPNNTFQFQHKQPEFDNESLRSYYLSRYWRLLLRESLKSRPEKGAVKMYEAGIRHWTYKGQSLSDHQKQIVADVSKAIDQAGSCRKLKKKLCLNYNSKMLRYIERGDILGRDTDEIEMIHRRVKRYLSGKKPALFD